MSTAELNLLEEDDIDLQDDQDDDDESLPDLVDALPEEDEDDDDRTRQLGFLEDVRMALCDESTLTSSKESRIFANTAGRVAGANLIMGQEFSDKVPALLGDLPRLHNYLKGVDPVNFPCWIEIHNGPVAIGCLFATWAPTQKSDTLVMMRMFRGHSKGAVPYVVSWQVERMRASQRLDESWNFSYVNRSGIPLTAKTRTAARMIGLLGIAALAFRLNPAILSPGGCAGTAQRPAQPTAEVHNFPLAVPGR